MGGTTDPDLNPDIRDDVRILDFTRQQWTLVTADVRPRGRLDQFLIGCGDQLIQFGGVSLDKSSSVFCTSHTHTFDFFFQLPKTALNLQHSTYVITTWA